MKHDTAGIEWAVKVPQQMIRRIYENDARGIVDDELIDKVGFALYDRCQSLVMIHDGLVQCPRCHQRFATGWVWPRYIDTEIVRCSHCGEWETSGKQYRASFQRGQLQAINAVPIFRTFVERYANTTVPRERVVLIDRLIHECHYAIARMPDGSLGRNPLPHATTANNLIEGGHDEVVAFLDALTYGEEGTPELEATQDDWREKAAQMKQRRPSKR